MFTTGGAEKPHSPPVAQPLTYWNTLSQTLSLLRTATELVCTARVSLSQRSAHSCRYCAPRVREVVTL